MTETGTHDRPSGTKSASPPRPKNRVIRLDGNIHVKLRCENCMARGRNGHGWVTILLLSYTP
jgi:hypothetical protein